MARRRPQRGGRYGSGRSEKPPQQRYDSVKAHWVALPADSRRRLLTVPVKRLARGAPPVSPPLRPLSASRQVSVRTSSLYFCHNVRTSTSVGLLCLSDYNSIALYQNLQGS